MCTEMRTASEAKATVLILTKWHQFSLFFFRMSENTTTTTIMPKDVIKSDIYEGRHWWMFVVLSVSLWVLCFVLVLIPRIIVYLCHRPQKRTNGSGKSARTDQVLVEPSFYSSIQNWAEDLISGNTTSGRILVVFAFVCSMVAFLLYLHGKFYFFFLRRLDIFRKFSWIMKSYWSVALSQLYFALPFP